MGVGAVAQKVPDHAHCTECRKVVPPGEKVCGPACKEERDSRHRKQRMWMIVFYGALVVAVLGFLSQNVL